MKKRIQSLLALSLVLMVCLLHSCDKYPTTIDNPEHGLANTTTLTISKIEIADSLTAMHFDIHFQPNQWIRIDAESYLKAGNEKLIVTRADGIQLGEEHYMDDTGKGSFTLYFPALPKGLKTVDFIESDCDDCFKIWNIDVTGKGLNYTADIPKGLTIDKKTALPPVELTSGKSVINLHLTGMPEGFTMKDPMIGITDFFLMKQSSIEHTTKEGNTYTYEFTQHASGTVWITSNGALAEVILSPGENIDVYIDMTARAIHFTQDNAKPNYATFTGKYAAINQELAHNNKRDYWVELNYGEEIATILDKEPQTWISEREAKIAEKRRQLDENKNLSLATKELINLMLNNALIENLANIQNLYEVAYRAKHNLNWGDPMDYTAPKYDDEMIMKFKDFDLDNTNYLYQGEMLRAYQMILHFISSQEKVDELTGTTTGFLQDMMKARQIMPKAENMATLTAKETETLDALSIPLFKEAYEDAMKEAQRKFDEAMAKGGFTIKEAPNVAGDKIVEAIIAENKGKAIFIDFWATWCGPCLSAMETLKPFKPEMKDHDVVIIYITGETSPKGTWMNKLPEIGANHYYLTAEQWSQSCDKYGIRGIPSYLIVDKNGKIVHKITGFPGVEALREEFSKIW